MSMNCIIINDISDFELVIDSSIFIGKQFYDELLQEEIDTNMWALSIEQSKRGQISISTWEQFIQNLIENRMQQVQKANIKHSVVFYMWFDEMAFQLRFNIISDYSKELPFGCKLHVVNSTYHILKAFLNSKGYISWDDLIECEKGGEDDSDEENEEYVLDVFVKALNV